MRKFLLTLLAAGLTLSVLPAVAADIVAEKAYSFATSPKQKNGAVFLKLSNAGDTDSELTGVKSDAANVHEFHVMDMEGGMMEMRAVDTFVVPSGDKPLMLEPTGKHIMLIDLKEQLVEGDSFTITLVFDDTEIETEVEIIAPGTKPNCCPDSKDRDHHDHHHHGHAH